MRQVLVGAALAATMLSPVFAADAPEMLPETLPVASMYDWSGFYIGAHAGYAFGDYTLFSASGLGPEVEVDGFAGGATLGFNWQWNSIVMGVEADISTGPDGETAVGTAGPFWSCNTGACNVDIEYYGTLRARLGFAHDRWMFYGTGGLAYAEVDGGIFNSPQQGGGSATGWAAGLGVEVAWTQHWTTKIEYLHVDLGDLPFGTGIGTEPFEGDGDFDVIRLGVNYKF